jgi:hypothetical protein
MKLYLQYLIIVYLVPAMSKTVSGSRHINNCFGQQPLLSIATALNMPALLRHPCPALPKSYIWCPEAGTRPRLRDTSPFPFGVAFLFSWFACLFVLFACACWSGKVTSSAVTSGSAETQDVVTEIRREQAHLAEAFRDEIENLAKRVETLMLLLMRQTTEATVLEPIMIRGTAAPASSSTK